MVDLYLVDFNWKEIKNIKTQILKNSNNSFIGVLRTLSQDNLFHNLAVISLLEDPRLQQNQIILSPISKSVKFCFADIINKLPHRTEYVRVFNYLNKKRDLEYLIEELTNHKCEEHEEHDFCVIEVEGLLKSINSKINESKPRNKKHRYIFAIKKIIGKQKGIKDINQKIEFKEKNDLSNLSELIYPNNIGSTI